MKYLDKLDGFWENSKLTIGMSYIQEIYFSKTFCNRIPKSQTKDGLKFEYRWTMHSISQNSRISVIACWLEFIDGHN